MINYRRSALVRRLAAQRALPSETPGSIDEAAFVDGVPGLVSHLSESDVPRGAPYFVRGWAVDLGRTQIPWALRVEIDGLPVAALIRAAEPRPDIARRFRSSNVLRSGFTAFIATKLLAVGPHVLRVRAVVGRYGTAFARLPPAVRFHIVERLAKSAAPHDMAELTDAGYRLDPLAPIERGGVLALSGHFLDPRIGRSTVVAARLDDDTWNSGWISNEAGDTAGDTRFHIRIRLDTISMGVHQIQLAARSRAGRWFALGGPRRLIVTSAGEQTSQWMRPLVDSGSASVQDAAGNRISRLDFYRVRSPLSIQGTVRRSSSIGLPLRLVARDQDNCDFFVPAWSAPSEKPGLVEFGAEIVQSTLAPGTYRLFVETPDATHRFVGRADTGCDLVVARRPPRLEQRS